MANKKTTQLPENTTWNDNDKYYHVTAAGVSKFIRASTIKATILAEVENSGEGSKFRGYKENQAAIEALADPKDGEGAIDRSTNNLWIYVENDENGTPVNEWINTGEYGVAFEIDLDPVEGNIDHVPSSDGVARGLAGKANTSHTHSIAETWLVNILSNYLLSSSFDSVFWVALKAAMVQGAGVTLVKDEGTKKITVNAIGADGEPITISSTVVDGDGNAVSGEAVYEHTKDYAKKAVWTPVTPSGGTVTLTAVNGWDDRYTYSESGPVTLALTGTWSDGASIWLHVLLASSTHDITLPSGFLVETEDEAQTTVPLTGDPGQVKRVLFVKKGSNWIVFEDSEGGASSFSELSGNARDNADLASELDAAENNAKAYADGLADTKQDISKDLSRAWGDSLLFDKKEILTINKTMTADITYYLAASGHLSDMCTRIDRIIADGIHALNFTDQETDFPELYPVDQVYNGLVLPAGQHRIWFFFDGTSVTVNIPSAGTSTNAAPIASGISISGSLISGSTIGGSYSYADTDGDPQNITASGTTYELRAYDTLLDAQNDVASGLKSGGTLISSGYTGGNSMPAFSYVLESADSGKRLVLWVRPVAQSGRLIGIWSASEVSSAVVAAGQPTFNSLSVVDDDTYAITFSEAVYTTAGGSGALTTADLIAEVITSANGVTSAATITSVTKTDGSALAGGETQIHVNVSYTGTPNGYEQIRFRAASGSAIYDVSGNPINVNDTTGYTYINTQTWTDFNGTSNRLIFGDILDEFFSQTTSKFSVEATVRNFTLSRQQSMWNKSYGATNQRAWSSFLEAAGGGSTFAFFKDGTSSNARNVTFGSSIANNTAKKIKFTFDATQVGNSGLDKVKLFIDDVEVIANKSFSSSTGTLPSNIFNSTAQLSFGVGVAADGSLNSTTLFDGEAKDIIIRDLNNNKLVHVPTVSVGVDISGNNRNGTWV